MAAYILRRIFWTVPVLIAVIVITFVLMHSVPGGPWDDGTRPMPPGREKRLNEYYGLDEPVWQQFGEYVYRLAQGDLGISFQQRNRPVRDILAEKIRPTITLGLLALGVSVTAGVTLGVASALRRNSALDYATMAFATLCASVPSFILGMLLLTVMTGHYHVLPTSGWGSAKAMIMPVLALSALPTAYICRITRASMLDVLDEDYVRTARAKGLHTKVVVVRHMLKNALIPVLTVTGPLAATLVTGSFVIEYLFSIPGAGRELVDSIHKQDYGMIMGLSVFYTVVVVLANLVVDVLYAFADPRIRYESRG